MDWLVQNEKNPFFRPLKFQPGNLCGHKFKHNFTIISICFAVVVWVLINIIHFPLHCPWFGSAFFYTQTVMLVLNTITFIHLFTFIPRIYPFRICLVLQIIYNLGVLFISKLSWQTSNQHFSMAVWRLTTFERKIIFFSWRLSSIYKALTA